MTQLFQDLDKTTAQLEEALTQAGAAVSFTYRVDKAAKKPLEASASLFRDGQPLTLALNVEEDSDSAFALRFRRTQGEETTSQITFRWNKAEETYVFTVESGEERDELTGTIQTSPDTILLTADTANGQALNDNSLTLRRSDPVVLPEFQDLITMSEDSILEVLQSAIMTAQEFLNLAV